MLRACPSSSAPVTTEIQAGKPGGGVERACLRDLISDSFTYEGRTWTPGGAGATGNLRLQLRALKSPTRSKFVSADAGRRRTSRTDVTIKLDVSDVGNSLRDWVGRTA